MREHLLKRCIRALWFRPGAIRRVTLGPLRGFVFRVSEITGLSPWYSGTERGHQRAMLSLVRPGDVVMDVGANWGLHSLLLSRLAGPAGRVVALEPLPEAFEALRWHLSANGCRNVIALPLALADTDGLMGFVRGESTSQGALDNTEYTDRAQHSGLEVSVRTLDSLIAELDLNSLRLVKIDVEGAESAVLSGAQRTLDRYRPYLVVDLHTPQQDVRVARILTDHDYVLQRLEGPPIKRVDSGWPDPEGVWGSLLAIPRAIGARPR
jgi:FkbM family methyltransferase